MFPGQSLEKLPDSPRRRPVACYVCSLSVHIVLMRTLGNDGSAKICRCGRTLHLTSHNDENIAERKTFKYCTLLLAFGLELDRLIH